MAEQLYITIGRQFGSGGREIGKKVAQALGVPYYDRELHTVAADRSGLSREFLRDYDEKHTTSSFLYSLVMGRPNVLTGVHGATVEQLASQAQREAVLSVAEEGSCVIVGRCADYILRDKPGLVRVFVSAEDEARVERICHRDGVTEKEAREKMKKMDRSRAAYYSFHTDRQWGVAESYDLCINSSLKGTDAAAALILQFCRS